MTSPDLTAANIDKIAELFPNVITETVEGEGEDKVVKRTIDFDALRQELSDHVVEGPQERYQLNWPGKREAAATANKLIDKTLRPVRGRSVDFDTTQNVVIDGDNLDALKLLQESYLGKVKLIYIDPPYNTGGDFIYDDDYVESVEDFERRSGIRDDEGGRLVANAESNGRFHSDWLSMMYPRLKLARNLLREDGVAFISIDDHEVDSLRKICAEIFGEKNFIAQIIWQKVYAPKSTAQWFSEDHDYVLVFARNKMNWRPRALPRTPEMKARYKNPDGDPRGPWKAADMSARNPYKAGVYPVTTPSGRLIPGPPRGTYWRFSEPKFKEMDADNRIWWGKDGDNSPAVKRFLSEVAEGRTPQTLWTYQEVGHTQDAKKTLLKYVPFEHTENVLNSVKPVELLQRILQLGTDPNSDDIVLDFFSGSGTTAHAVLKQNAEDGGKRRFVAVQMHEPLPTPEPDFDSILGIGLTRIDNVAQELREKPMLTDELDLGYRLLKVDSTNLTDVLRTPDATVQSALTGLADSIKPSRTSEDLLFQVLLDWGLELALPISVEHVEGHEVHLVEEGLALIACFEPAITLDLVRAMAQRAAEQPEGGRVVFRDSAFASDDARINVEQIFREIAPSTEVKTI
ncbi:site-specific DNA-methyltransferase [Saccharopolyspora gregorii]